MIGFLSNRLPWFDSRFCPLLTWALVHFVWQGCLLAIGFAIVRRALVRRSANVRYAAGMFILLLMAACLPATLSLIDPAAIDAPSPASGRAALADQPLPPVDDAGFDRPAGSGATDGARGAALAKISTYATAAYGLGLTLMLTRVFVGLSIGRRLRRASIPICDPATLALVRAHATRLALQAVPAIAWCSRVSVPVVAGVLRPMILLPISLATGLAGRQLEYVLLHELAHIRRYDPLANLLERLIESLLFFHPAVWWLTRQMSIERENACDDAVLHAGCQRQAYADTLLQVAELCATVPGGAASPAGLLAATGENPSQLACRIHRLFQVDPPATVRPAAPAVALLVLFGASLIALAAWRSPATAQVATSPPVETPRQEKVVEIRIVGNEIRSADEILNSIDTRIGGAFDQATLEKDVRTLAQKKWFLDVRTIRQQVDRGVRLTFEVVERPTLLYVKYLGNTKIKHKRLAKETELKAGSPLDPDAIEAGRRRIEEHYRSKGFSNVGVRILEGTNPGDRGAIYLINEGDFQEIEKTQFVGNTITLGQRLKTQIESKPPMLGLFEGEYDDEKVDKDIDRLIAHYRGLGFFRARVSHQVSTDANHDRPALTFVIEEGPRYRIHDVRFIGNQELTSELLREGMTLKEGDYFVRRQLDKELNRLRGIYRDHGYRTANIQGELRFEEEPATLSVVFSIKEADFLDSGVRGEKERR